MWNDLKPITEETGQRILSAVSGVDAQVGTSGWNNLKPMTEETGRKIVDAVAQNRLSNQEALDNRIKKFYTGNLGAVNIADSDDGAVRNLVIGGRSEQISTNGYQLLDYATFAGDELRGVKTDILQDGSVHISGTSTESGWCGRTFLPNLVITPGTYVFQVFGNHPKMAILTADWHSIVDLASSQSSAIFTVDSDKIAKHMCCFSSVAGEEFEFTVKFMLENGGTAHDWEPYTGGAPSPSPDYPQEIRSVENCAMNVSNADGTETQTAMIPVTLRGIGDVRDELYVYADGAGTLVQRITCEVPIKTKIVSDRESDIAISVQIPGGLSRISIQNTIYSDKFLKGDTLTPYRIGCYQNHFYVSLLKEIYPTFGDAANYVKNLNFYVMYAHNPIETALTAEQVKALFDLRTYYGGTNISYQSENGVEPVVNFDYACALENFVEYIKAAQGDDRKFIYDMDERMTDAEYVAALAYVNSEYAAALTELEV